MCQTTRDRFFFYIKIDHNVSEFLRGMNVFVYIQCIVNECTVVRSAFINSTNVAVT